MTTTEMIKKYGENCIGNVIRIVDDRTILVNVGTGTLTVGASIQIYELGEPILDLDGSSLGNYIFVKDELEVIQVESAYSVCKKMKTVTRSFSLALSPLLETKEFVPLNIQQEDINKLQPHDRLVRIGDPIKFA